MNSERILGIPFFNGTASEAVEQFLSVGGLLIVPASPALLNLKYDAEYRRAAQAATIALPDSTLLTLAWKAATGRSLKKISGIAYLKSLITNEDFRKRENTLWLVSTEQTKVHAVGRLQHEGLNVDSSSFYVLPEELTDSDRYNLLTEIEHRHPGDIMVAIGTPVQEKLGSYLREYAMPAPNVHCIGAALSFLTGDERPIPDWAEKLDLAWLVRLTAQPRMIVPRLGITGAVTSMVLKYKSEMPPLQKRWSDV